MNRYRVIVTLQSGTNAPVEIVYARDTDAMGATHAMTSAIVTHTEDSAMPESIRTNLVSVRIETIN